MKVILTGATGMVGEGVLLVCLEHPAVQHVTVLTRRATGRTHPKLSELILPDFLQVENLSTQLSGYDACFFCAGVSSIGMNEATFTKNTYDTTLTVATTLAQLNPNMVFDYVSGRGTDSSGQGRVMWARVKGRTENALLQLPFRGAYNFRPGMMKAMPGQQHLLKAYKALAWLYPLLKLVAPGWTCTLREVGEAMINTVLKGYHQSNIEVKDIKALAKLS